MLGSASEERSAWLQRTRFFVKMITDDIRTAEALTQNKVKREPGRSKKGRNMNNEDLPISTSVEESETDDCQL